MQVNSWAPEGTSGFEALASSVCLGKKSAHTQPKPTAASRAQTLTVTLALAYVFPHPM